MVCSFSRRDAAHLLPLFLHSVVRLPAPTKVTGLHAPSIRYGQNARPYQLYTTVRAGKCYNRFKFVLVGAFGKGGVEVSISYWRVCLQAMKVSGRTFYNYPN